MNAEPWMSAKNGLFNVGPYPSYVSRAVATVTRGGIVTTRQANFANDAKNACTLMVKGMATKDTAYADAAIRVVDAWSSALTIINGNEAILVAKFLAINWHKLPN